MLREFETRRPQFDQLTQSAEGILSQTSDSAQDPKDLAEVRADLDSISEQWDDLTQRLTQRSNNIDQAQGTSERYQVRPVRLWTDVLCEQSDISSNLTALHLRPCSGNFPPVLRRWVRGWTLRRH